MHGAVAVLQNQNLELESVMESRVREPPMPLANAPCGVGAMPLARTQVLQRRDYLRTSGVYTGVTPEMVRKKGVTPEAA